MSGRAFLSQLPEPSRLWVRFVPRVWPGPALPWTHLGRAGLGDAPEPGRTPAVPELDEALDDVLYLPPVGRGRVKARDTLVQQAIETGTPVLAQILPGDKAPKLGTVVFDPLPALLAGNFAAAVAAPPGSWVVWPLIAGLTDDPELARTAFAALAAGGAAGATALTLELAPDECRRLAETADEEAFLALFHHPRPLERDFDRLAAAAGLATAFPRPLPRLGVATANRTASNRLAGNRRLAGEIARVGELWSRLGRPAVVAEELFLAARFVDSTHLDVVAIGREGNLGVLAAIGPIARGLIEDLEKPGGGGLRQELEVAYVEAS